MYKLLAVAMLAGLLAGAGCSGDPPPPPPQEPAYLNPLSEEARARAEYEALRRDYAARKLALRMQQWQAIQQRAEEQTAEQRREEAIREAAVRRRWSGYP
jgi:hypothetical protein